MYEQTTQPRIDRQQGVIRRCHVLGLVSRNDGRRYDLAAQRAAVGAWEGMPVFIDHKSVRPRSPYEKPFGILHNPVVDERGTWGDLHYDKDHKLAPLILEDTESGLGLVHLSARTSCLRDGNVITDLIPVGIDLVIRGAATLPLAFSE